MDHEVKEIKSRIYNRQPFVKICRRGSRSPDNANWIWIWSFHVGVSQRTAQKCTKNYNERSQSLNCSLNLLFSHVAFAVLVFLNPLMTSDVFLNIMVHAYVYWVWLRGSTAHQSMPVIAFRNKRASAEFSLTRDNQCRQRKFVSLHWWVIITQPTSRQDFIKTANTLVHDAVDKIRALRTRKRFQLSICAASQTAERIVYDSTPRCIITAEVERVLKFKWWIFIKKYCACHYEF